MGDSSTAPTAQTDVPRRKTGAERQRAFRQRQRKKREIAMASAGTASLGQIGGQTATAAIEPPVTTSVTVTRATIGALPVTLVTKK